jgi:hydroxymethylglutaryl-CoA lyase
MMMAEHVEITEVGPRDGLQMAHGMMPTALKCGWIRAMAAAGVGSIEVGSFVPAKIVPQMADTPEVVADAVTIPGLRVVALVPNLRGAQAAYAAGAHAVTIPISASDSHSLANTHKSTEAQIAEVGRITAWLREQPRAVHVEAGVSTAFGCSMEGVVPVERVVWTATGLAEAGADTIALCDTVGYAHPTLVRATIRAVRGAVGPRLRTLHLHDTLGMGIANALAGLEEGIRAFDGALAGLGGCPFAPGASGNVTTEDLVFMLESMGFATGIDLEKLLATRALLAAGLPHERLRGQVALAGIPRTFHRAA